jgi:hypothetical protein
MRFIGLSDWQFDAAQNLVGITSAGDDFMVQNGRKPWSISAVDANTIRFEVRSGDHWTFDSGNKERSEIADQQLVKDGTPIHVSYQFEVEPGARNTASWLAMGQFHQNDYPGAPALSPPFAIGLDGERMYVCIHYSDANGQDVYKYLFIDKTDIQRGHFYDMDIKVTFDPAGNGHLSVVRDGVQIVDYNGPLGYASQSSVYWKEGVYRASASETIAIEYRDLSIQAGQSAPPAASAPIPPKSVTTNGTDTIVKNFDTAGKLVSQAVSHQDGSRDVFNFAVTGQAYAVEHTLVNAAGVAVEIDRSTSNGTLLYHHVAGPSDTTTDTFDTHGNALTKTVLHKDGSRDVTNFAVTGQAYTSEHTFINATGKIGEVDRYASDGTLLYKYVAESDGSTTDTFDAHGKLQSEAFLHNDGSRELTSYAISGQAYTTEHLLYAASGQLMEVDRHNGDKLVYSQITNADGTTVVDRFDANGLQTSRSVLTPSGAHDEYLYKLGALVEHDVYTAGGKLAFSDALLLDGSHKVTAFAQNQTLTSASATNDTFISAGADNFLFAGHFGKDTISGFHAGDGAGHDQLTFQLAGVNDFSKFLTQYVTSSGHDTIITIDAGDTITLHNVAVGNLKAANIHILGQDGWLHA